MLFTLERATLLYAAKLKVLSPDEYQENEDLLAYRDSVIQRLEYCVDGFWKCMKAYLEIVQ
ncbi:MAG: Nucleotidyltransferase substrate binding protein like [Candidatus Dependentiae bacterium]|nr:Nucleotidyltransferase substrate binding protein like [Candidatus Dependentiae bacterium]